MNDKIFEIRDNEINLEEITTKIRENIQRRMDISSYPPNPDIIDNLSKEENTPAHTSDESLQCDLVFINKNWDIHNNKYFIGSHHPYIGKFLVKGREMVHGEVQRYVDPIISRQVEFNASTMRILNETAWILHEYQKVFKNHTPEQYFFQLENKLQQESERIEQELNARIEAKGQQEFERIEQELNARIEAKELERQAILVKERKAFEESIVAQVNSLRKSFNEDLEELSAERKEILQHLVTSLDEESGLVTQDKFKESEDSINKFFSRINFNIQNKIGLANILTDSILSVTRLPDQNTNPGNENHFDYNFFNEEINKAWIKESGSSINKPNIFDDALNVFENSKNVLDIGCGQGYFLQRLKENNIGGYGIDVNPDIVQFCQQQGLNVQLADAITHLSSLQDKSLDGIFISQLVEHLSPDSLYSLLKCCYEKLQYGSYIVLSTPNILSVQVSSSLFYLDLSHKTHIHPEVLKLLFRIVGFRKIQELHYQPVPEDHKLKFINDELINDDNREVCKITNNNIEFLNKFLFGPRDFVLIAKK
jgi:O-antigen chain-terminating methyltransferase